MSVMKNSSTFNVFISHVVLSPCVVESCLKPGDIRGSVISPCCALVLLKSMVVFLVKRV